MASGVADIAAEIAALKARRQAVVLAHNYCLGEVQDAADFTGDSLELARIATRVTADVIVCCGVYFMAETAKILNPGKTVLIPDPAAGCPMADMADAAALRSAKAGHPGAKVVTYVNSTAAVKAESDICVTSGNAEKVMRTFAPTDEILFVPDRNLGGYVAARLGREYRLWPGCCPVHARLTAAAVRAARSRYPGAAVLVHPECEGEVRALADECLSTGGMCAFVKASPLKEFVIGTETGILHRLERENPGKVFHPVGDLVCADMKRLTLAKLRDALRDNRHEVTVDADVAERARAAIAAMLKVG